MVDPQTRKLARQMVKLEHRLKSLETTPQLAHSSIDDYAVPVYDKDGNLVVEVGKQKDGTWGAPPLRGPVPSRPKGVSALGGPGMLTVSWSGEYERDAAPLDFDTLEILVDGVLAGAIPNRDGGTVSISAEQGYRFVAARIRTLVPRHSSTTSPFSVEVGPPADQLFLDAREAIEAAEEQIQQGKDDLEAERLAREAALAEAAETLTELEERLDGIADSEELEELRGQIAAAQEAVEQAQADATAAGEAVAEATAEATAAKAAAETANDNALAAAGIARDKGRIYYQPTAPTDEEAKSPNNLWIDSDDGRVYVWSGTAWTESESESLRDAAQAALVAQQTAEAADSKAQQAASAAAAADAKADAAQGAAAAAQAAAEAAQTTADEATLDARDAHNAAVEAGERAEALRAAGENLLTLGSFDNGTLKEIFSGIGTNNAIAWAELVTSTDAYSGTRYIRLTGDNGWNGSMLLGEVPVTPGRTYRVSVAARITPGMVAPSGSVGWPMYWFQQDGSSDNGNWTDIYYHHELAEKLTPEWQVFTDDVTAKPGAAQLRPRLYGSNGAISPGEGVDFDSIRVIDATELVAAEKAAQDAQARADEAMAEAESKATPAEVQAAADAAEGAAKTAAAADAKAKADQAKADALSDAAVTAQEKADAAQAQAVADAAQDAAAKADKALQDALAALATARGEITAEITASANGKNSITRSLNAPSGDGVVRGDQWYQVDGNGDAFASWYWAGSAWTPSLVKNEMMESLDVHKLQVTGDATMDSAVIDKLFAETFAAHKITANEVIISGSQNLIPGAEPGSNRGLTGFAWDAEEGALRADDRSGVYCDEPFTLAPGEYMVEADIKASVEGTTTYIGVLGGSDVPYRYRYGISNVEVGTGWQHFAAPFSIGEGEGGTVEARFLPAYRGDKTATTWYRNPTIRPRVGAVLIEDGAVGADKIIAEEVAAEVSNLVRANVEKLVVTDGATINEAVILKLATEMITAGAIRTAETGQRVVIDQSGIVMYGLDPDGNEFELVRIGPSGDNLITTGDTTISPAGVQASSGDFGEVTVGGQTLEEILAAYPRGRVAQNRFTRTSDYSNEGQIRISTSFDAEPHRKYRVTVTPFDAQAQGDTWITYKLGWAEGGTISTSWSQSNTFGWAQTRMFGTYEQQIPGIQADFTGSNVINGKISVALYTTTTNNSGVRLLGGGGHPVVLSVDDVGMAPEDTGAWWASGNGGGGDTTPPPPSVQRYTKTYSATGTKTYNGNGSLRDSSGDVTQGLYGGGPRRFNRRGGWEFPSFTNDLSGATVEKVEMYVYANHTWSSAGSTVNLATHTGNIRDSLNTFTSIYSWKRNTGKWVTLPSSLYNGFKNGSYKGVGVYPTSTSTSQYAIFNPGAKIKITYTK